MSGHYLNSHLMPRYAALPQIELRLSPGDGLKGLQLPPHLVVSSMRTVAAVIALVACVQAGLWALARDNLERARFRRPARQRFLRAVRSGNANPDEGGRRRPRRSAPT